MSLQTIPRTAVRSWLSVVRLPLSATELVVGKQGSDWPPALAFEGFEAGVKRGFGTLFGDSQLVQEALLEQGKLEQVGRAAELEVEAERRRLEGQARFEDRKETLQERNEQRERDRKEREAKLEKEQEKREKAVEAKAREKEKAAQAADQARQKAVAAQERQARATRLSAESEALQHERQAVEAKGEVLDVDRALQATKAARKKS